MSDSQAREHQRRRREFIRAHHPDRGGDADVFAAGLRAFDGGRPPDPEPLPPVIVVRRRRWPARLGLAAARWLRRDSRPPRVR